MARIPGPEALGERPGPRPAGGLASYRGDSPAFEAPGQALSNLGSSLQAEGEKLFRQVKIEEEKADSVRAQDAINKLKLRALDLEYGDQGYKKILGGAAASRQVYPEYLKRFEDAVADIRGTLATEGQREKFKLHADPVSLQLREGIARHLAQQGKVFEKETYDATVQIAQRNATAKWDNPVAIATEIAGIANSVKNRAESEGWSPEMREAELRKETGKVHNAVVQQAIASGQPGYAQRWYEANKADIDLPTAKALEVTVRDGEQKQLSNGYRSEVLAAKGNYRVLSAIRDKVLTDEKLDDGRRNALIGPIQNEMAMIERRGEAAQERRARALERRINDFNANTLAGYPGTDPQRGLELINATRGTELEPLAKDAFALANATREFSALTPVQQAGQLAAVEAEARRDPTRVDRKIVSAWRHIHTTQQEEAKANPTGLYARQGLVELAPLDITKPDATPDAIQQRFQVAEVASRRFGVPMKPLQPEEVQILTASLRKASAEQKAVYFGQLRNASGGNTPGYMAVMSQLAPDDPVSAVAGSQAGKDRWPEASLILRGQAALQPDKKSDGSPGKSLVTMPPREALEREFKDQVKDAFAGKPEARSAAFQAVEAAYAALAVDKPKDADPKSVNTDFFKKAMQAVVGEVAGYKGKSVVLPYGYNSAMFEDGVARLLDQALAQGLKTELSRDRLLDLPLVNRGDGRYVFMAGDSKVLDERGREVVVDFNPGLPFRTSGVAPTEPPRKPSGRSSGR